MFFLSATTTAVVFFGGLLCFLFEDSVAMFVDERFYVFHTAVAYFEGISIEDFGKCMTNNVIYKAEVTTTDNQTTKQYVGMTSNAFKNRFRNHQKSFRDKKHQNETELSKFIWSLKEKKKEFEVKWSILKRAVVYHNEARRCNFCLEEKLQIMKADKRTLLNKRS